MRPIFAVVAVVALSAASAEARNLTGFDDLANGTQVTDQYRGIGVVFSGPLFVAGPGAFTNAISPTNSVYFFNTEDVHAPASVEARFVIPGTFTPAVTDFVCFTPTDASQFNTLYTMTAYDVNDNVIGINQTIVESTGVYNPGEDPPVFISVPGIARVVLHGSVSEGNMVIEGDDFVFDPPTPAPGSGLALLSGLGLASSRRRRST